MPFQKMEASTPGQLLTAMVITAVAATVIAGCAAKVQSKATAQPVPQVVQPKETSVAPPPQPAARKPLVIPGTGALVGTPRKQEATQSPDGEGYQLSFIDTEIAAVTASVLGDGLGLSYVVDPQVKGMMTLQAARPLKRDEVLPAFEAALNLHGAALVEVNGTYNVVPAREAPRRIAGLRGPSARTTAGFSVQIVPLKYAGAAEMEKVLRPFAPDGGIMRVDEARNLLVLSGSSRELSVMREVIDTFDVDWLSGMSFGLYPVEYVDVKTLADELGNIFADGRSPIGNVVRIVPLARLNSLMVITHDAAYLQHVEAWIHRLDIGAATPGRRIYVYDVQNGKADDLANSLGKILSIAVDGVDEGGANSSPPRDLATSDSASSSLGNRTRSSSAREPVAAARSGAGSDSVQGALKIVPNVESNALLIFATPSEFSLIEGALKRLDVPPIQVLIEASLAEVSLTEDLRFGLQWAVQGDDGQAILTEGDSSDVAQSFPGFSYLFTGATNIRAVLNALETITDVDVISSPKLLVLNNREAELQIGDQVPVTVQSAVSTSSDSSAIVNSIQQQDTGVILRITPRVNRSGMVLLDVAQEVSDVVATTSSNIDSPTIQQRRISSTVAVRNGETIALGGLIRDTSSRTREGLPLLSKVPLIGGLFRSTDKNNRRTELIVLITPRVIRSAQESDEVMDELKQQFHGLKDRLPQWDPSSVAGSSELPKVPANNVPASAPSARP